MTAITRTPLWESIEVDATRNDLPEYTAVSDGTGNGVSEPVSLRMTC